MALANQDFQTFAGDAARPVFTVLGTDISAVAEIEWALRRQASSAPILTKTKTGGGIVFVTSGADGKFRVLLTGADTTGLTGYYVHEAIITDAGGLQTTVATGRVQVGLLPSWTYDPGSMSSTPLYQIRFYLGDTDASSPEMYDEEILWAYTQRGNVWGATALCALALAAKYSRLTSISADGVSQALNQKAPAFKLLATEYQRKEAIYGATAFLYGTSVTDMLATISNSDRVPDIFRLGMNDNPPSDGVHLINSSPSGTDAIDALDEGIL